MFENEKEDLAELYRTVITCKKTFVYGLPNPASIFKLRLPPPREIRWHRSVSMNRMVNRTQDESITSITRNPVTDITTYGVNSIPTPKMESGPRVLSLDFVVINEEGIAIKKSTLEKVESFFEDNSIYSNKDGLYTISIIKEQKTVLEFEGFKLHEVTVDRTPFKILDSKSFRLRLTLFEAQAPTKSIIPTI